VSVAIDSFDLQRFVDAQDGSYAGALAELRQGRKRGHWIWFIFPQLRGLGHSRNSTYFGIASLAEARAFCDHPILGPRLIACSHAMLGHRGQTAEAILGGIDALKFRSSMTLFDAASAPQDVFADCLSAFYEGRRDGRTTALLRDPDGG
jgi:uncharacterized protein (DUF1810 family)